jgi:hypothetical protein
MMSGRGVAHSIRTGLSFLILASKKQCLRLHAVQKLLVPQWVAGYQYSRECPILLSERISCTLLTPTVYSLLEESKSQLHQDPSRVRHPRCRSVRVCSARELYPSHR